MSDHWIECDSNFKIITMERVEGTDLQFIVARISGMDTIEPAFADP
jgi:hypothetical protein